MNERAVVYVRVSTDEQDQFSPEAQLDECRAYAKGRLEIVREFRETKSGWKANARAVFYQMLEFIRKEKIRNLIYAYGDRLSRNTEDYVSLKATGVILHNAISGISFSPSDPEHYDQTAAFEHDQVEAKRFSAKNSYRVRQGYAKIVAKGSWPHSLPIGLQHGPEISKEAKKRGERRVIEFETMKDRDKLVHHMFRLWATAEYTREGIKAKVKELGLRSRSGKVLSVSQVEEMLKDIKYTGRYFDWEGERHEWKENAPGLISQELFDEAQEVFIRKKRRVLRTGEDYKYYKLLTCDFCGCDIIRDPQEKTLANGEKKVYPYYRCTGGKSREYYQEHFGKPKCPMYYGRYWLEKDIDEFFELAIENLYVDPDTYSWVKSQIEEDYKDIKESRAAEAINLKKQLTETEGAIGPMAQKAALSKPPLQAIFERELENLERRRVEMEVRLKDIETGKEAVSLGEIGETLELSKSLKDNYLAAPPEKRKLLNKLMFRTVKLTKKGSLPTPDEDDQYLTLEPFYFVWNEPFKSLWAKGFIKQMEKATADLTEEQKAYKPALIGRERA